MICDQVRPSDASAQPRPLRRQTGPPLATCSPPPIWFSKSSPAAARGCSCRPPARSRPRPGCRRVRRSPARRQSPFSRRNKSRSRAAAFPGSVVGNPSRAPPPAATNSSLTIAGFGLEGFGVFSSSEFRYSVTQKCHHAGQIFRLLLKISVVTLQVEINSISEASAHYSQKQRGRGGSKEGRKKRKRGERERGKREKRGGRGKSKREKEKEDKTACSRGFSAVVARPLCMRKAVGSNPTSSINSFLNSPQRSLRN